MTSFFIVLAANLVALACVVGATFLALLCSASVKFSESGNKKE